MLVKFVFGFCGMFEEEGEKKHWLTYWILVIFKLADISMELKKLLYQSWSRNISFLLNDVHYTFTLLHQVEVLAS